MKTRHIIVLLLAASGGEVRGRTMIQKEMYFLSERLGTNLGYRPYYYGPYSDEVQWELDRLEGIGLVRMRAESLGQATRCGFEVNRYDFNLTEYGKEMAGWLKQKQEHREESKKIEEFIGSLRSVPGINYINLSLAAKVHYVLGKNGPLTQDEIRENARALGWAILPEDIEGAVQILEKLGFVKAD